MLTDAWDFTVYFIYSLFINQIIWHVIHDVHMCVQAYRPMHEEGSQRKMSVSSSITGLFIPLMLTNPEASQVTRKFQRAHILPSPPTTAPRL